MIRILFTGGGGAGNEALWRLLGHRYDMHFGDADTAAIDPAIPATRRHSLPWANQPSYVDEMAQLCRRLEVDILVPGVDEELLGLAKRRAELIPTSVLLPSAEYVRTMLDKLSMVRSLETKGIPVPHTVTLDMWDGGMRFPCISKPRSGRGSRDVRILHTPADAEALRSALGNEAHQVILQEKIEGVEFTVQVVASESGHLHAIVPVRIEVKRGITLRAETEDNALVSAACRAIHRARPVSGCYNIQLILTRDGRAIPFEINPRVSTTLCLVVAAGIDPIGIFREGSPSDSLVPFTSGLRLQRHWKNTFTNSDGNDPRFVGGG